MTIGNNAHRLCGTFLLTAAAVAAVSASCGVAYAAGQPAERPNILWIIVEDQSAHYGCYGEPLVTTPNVDRLATEGAKFSRAFVTAPVCSTCRSALITGMYQTSIGAHHHRSSRGEAKIYLPEHVKLIPRLFQEAGYWTCNGNIGQIQGKSTSNKIAKTDYNFVWDESVYNGGNWAGRAPGQPFFAQVQLGGGKRRTAGKQFDPSEVPPPVDPADVKLPPYYPDHPVLREDWARYLDSFNFVDIEVGQIMDRLKEEGIADNTVVMFMTDHGISHARGKQFCYEEGIRVPLIVWAPGRVPSGAVRDDLVAHIDMSATSLDFAGIDIPDYLESRPLFGPDARPRDYVVSARDRCDETVEHIRSVRVDGFKYIRNFLPERPHLQPCAYKDKKEILVTIRELYNEGKLAGHPAARLFAVPRPEEELYDLKADPWELTNLADDPAHRKTLKHLRGILRQWIDQTGDQGQNPESAEMYDSDMKVYLDNWTTEDPAHRALIEANIRQMKEWAAEGK